MSGVSVDLERSVARSARSFFDPPHRSSGLRHNPSKGLTGKGVPPKPPWVCLARAGRPGMELVTWEDSPLRRSKSSSLDDLSPRYYKNKAGLETGVVAQTRTQAWDFG